MTAPRNKAIRMEFSQDEIDSEVWRKIPGYGGRYEASSLGRIRSFAKSDVGVLMTGKINTYGYVDILLTPTNGKRRTYLAHRLVMQSFRPEDFPNNLHVHHINGIRNDNRLENLSLLTPQEHKDADAHKQVRGEQASPAVLKETDVREIKSMHMKGLSGADIAKEFGVARTTISKILRGGSWTHVHVEGFRFNSKAGGQHLRAFSDDQVREIRHIYSMGELSHDKIGERFGVNGWTIGRIVNRQTYKNVK